MARLFFAEEFVRHETTSTPAPQTIAFQIVEQVLPELELRVIEFLSEWIVSLLVPAKHLLELRAPHFVSMLDKAYWFRELYIGL